jgi:hypothetical protein
MFILDMEQTAEAPTLDQLLRDWWASLLAWLRRQPSPESKADDDSNEHERSESLIL